MTAGNHDDPTREPTGAAQPDAPPPIATSPLDPPAAETRPQWPLWQRLAFRFLLVYYLLYAFPGPVRNLLSTSAGVIHYAAKASVGEDARDWVEKTPLRWPRKWAFELSKVERGRQEVTTWMDEHGLAPYEVIHQRTGSGDTGHDIAVCLANLVLALLVVGIWSVLRRRPRGYPSLGRWLHLIVRFDLAFWLLGYGSSKLYGSQFGELSLTRLTQDIGDTWPMSMVGTFMQASPAYEVFGGLGEVLGALLLFHRRTALLGALISLVVMSHVCALNWLCGVPVKLFSLHLWLYALFLLAPWRCALAAVFLKNRPSEPVNIAVPVWRWLRWPVLLSGWIWILSALVLLHVGNVAPKPWMKGREKSALYGVWMVERMVVDGVEVPKTDAKRWRFFAVDRGKLAWARDALGARTNFEFDWDGTAGVAQVRNFRSKDPAAPWTIAASTKVVPVDPPLLLRNADRGKRVDGERRSLVLTGTWAGKKLELHTVEKRFRLQTGFRFRQELPDFW